MLVLGFKLPFRYPLALRLRALALLQQIIPMVKATQRTATKEHIKIMYIIFERGRPSVKKKKKRKNLKKKKKGGKSKRKIVD